VGFALGLGGESYKTDDAINDMNQKYLQYEKNSKDRNDNPWNYSRAEQVDYMTMQILKDLNKDKVANAKIEADRFGIGNQFTGKEVDLTLAQSQLLGAFKSLEGNYIAMGNELAGRSLTKASVGNLMKGDTLKSAKEILALDVKMYELGQKRASLGKQNTASARDEIAEIDKTILKLQAERDKKAKPFQLAAEDVKDFEKHIETTWSNIQNSDMPIAYQKSMD
jgi:hypothetical protein